MGPASAGGSLRRGLPGLPAVGGAVLCSLLLASSPLAAQAEPRADHVVLVSVDGLRPDFYLPGSSWPAPNMQQMARDGAHAEGVRGVFPTVTYPSHTTIVTGALPARHGIYYNRPFEPEGQSGEWYWHESGIQVPTLWDAVRGAGRRTAAISWPVTVGAPVDWLVPEVYSLDPNVDRLLPMREGSTPGLWQELEREATGRLNLRNYSAAYITRDDTTGVMAAYVLETHRPALLALHLITTDSAQHAHGRESDRIRRAVGAADRAIGAVRDAAERAGILDRTAFVITGDHGFVDLHTQVMPNVWLAEAGLHGTEPDRGEWRATFHPSGGSTFLHLRDAADEEALKAVRAILADLPQPIGRLFRIVERDELDEIGASPSVPFALAGALGTTFGSDASGDAVRPTDGGTHGHFPTDFPEILTGFVGWGAGFEAGRTVHRMGLTDIADLIAMLLDVDFESPDGAPPLGVLTR